jgi:hypothetical protein
MCAMDHPRALFWFPRAAGTHYGARYELVPRSFGNKLMSRDDKNPNAEENICPLCNPDTAQLIVPSARQMARSKMVQSAAKKLQFALIPMSDYETCAIHRIAPQIVKWRLQ